MNISDKLRMLRENAGYSQNDVAKLLGITRTAYVKYETGDSQPTRKLKKLAEIFNVSVDFLLSVENTNKEIINTQEMMDGAFYLFKPEEIEHIKKYRQLNADGKKEIDNLIDFKLFQQSKTDSAKATQNKVG